MTNKIKNDLRPQKPRTTFEFLNLNEKTMMKIFLIIIAVILIFVVCFLSTPATYGIFSW